MLSSIELELKHDVYRGLAAIAASSPGFFDAVTKAATPNVYSVISNPASNGVMSRTGNSLQLNANNFPWIAGYVTADAYDPTCIYVGYQIEDVSGTYHRLGISPLLTTISDVASLSEAYYIEVQGNNQAVLYQIHGGTTTVIQGLGTTGQQMQALMVAGGNVYTITNAQFAGPFSYGISSGKVYAYYTINSGTSFGGANNLLRDFILFTQSKVF